MISPAKSSKNTSLHLSYAHLPGMRKDATRSTNLNLDYISVLLANCGQTKITKYPAKNIKNI